MFTPQLARDAFALEGIFDDLRFVGIVHYVDGNQLVCFHNKHLRRLELTIARTAKDYIITSTRVVRWPRWPAASRAK
jgi:hypothetical protein